MEKITLRSPMRTIHKKVKWTIDCFEERMRECEDNISTIRSPKFAVTGSDSEKYEFGFSIFPYNREWLGVTITSSKAVRANFKISIFDKLGKKVAAKEGSFHNKKQRMIQRFCLNSLLQKHPQDKLIVRCDLDLMLPDPDVSFGFGQAASVEDDWRKKLLTMAEAGQRTDLTLVSNDGARFPCHKLVLASRSSMFKDMVENTEAAEDNGNAAELFLAEMNGGLLRKFIQFAYTGQVDVVDAEMGLYAAAQKYDLPDLREVTGQALVSSLTVDNVLDAFVLFDRHNCDKTDYAVAAVRFAAKNIKEVMASESVTASPEAGIKLMRAAMQHLTRFI